MLEILGKFLWGILLFIFLWAVLALILINLFNLIKIIFSYLIIKKIDFIYLDWKKRKWIIFLWFLFFWFYLPIKIKVKYRLKKLYYETLDNFYYKIPNYLILNQDKINLDLFKYENIFWVNTWTIFWDWGYDDVSIKVIYMTSFNIDFKKRTALFFSWSKRC